MQPVNYKDLTVSVFVRGYLIVLKSVQDTQVKEQMVLHLKELMEDMDVYGWDKVQVFHATWMNQMEQCRCEWTDDDQKVKLRRALVWHAAMSSKCTSTATLMGARKNNWQHYEGLQCPCQTWH